MTRKAEPPSRRPPRRGAHPATTRAPIRKARPAPLDVSYDADFGVAFAVVPALKRRPDA